jgi:hypothetical protein
METIHIDYYMLFFITYTLSALDHDIVTNNIQQIFAITIPETKIVFIQSHHSRDSYSRHRNTARYQQQEQSENVPE